MIVKTAQIYYFCLSSDTTEMRRLRQVRPQDETAGPCFPTGGWFLRGRLNLILFVQLIIVCSVDCVITQLIALLHCYNSHRTHVYY